LKNFSERHIMFRKELVNEAEVITECIEYRNALNHVVGVILFSLGVGCVGTPNPQRMALVGLSIVAPILLYAYQQFPPSIKALRQLYDETKDAEIGKLLCHIENEHMNYKVMFSIYLIYIVGFLFYALVLLSKDFSCWIKTVSS